MQEFVIEPVTSLYFEGMISNSHVANDVAKD